MKKWLRQWLCCTSFSVEEENAVLGVKRNSVITQESDVGKELEHDESQPQKKLRKDDEKSIAIYGQEQGPSSNSQLTYQLDWLSCNSSLCQKTKTLQEKMGHLSARGHDVLKELEHAEFQPGKKVRKEAHHWLTLVQRKKDEVQSMIKDAHGSSSNSILSGCIERFIEEADDLIQRSKFPNGLVLLDQESTRLPLLLGIKPVGINFQENTAQILGWLQSQEQHHRCLWDGRCRENYIVDAHTNQLLQDFNVYGCVYWVTVSQNWSVHKLQEDIAKVLGVEILGEVDERRRAAILYNKIVARGQTELILDDMWEKFLGDRVGIPLEEILSSDEAWGLFVDKLGNYDTLEKEARHIARVVANECGGLPLAIATMARTMTGIVDINEWKNSLNELKCIRDQADMKEEEQWSKDLVKVSLSDNHIKKISSGMAPMTPNLTVLMLNGNPLEEISESVYVPSVAKVKNLRVLDLERCDMLEAAPLGLEKVEVKDLDSNPTLFKSINDLDGYDGWTRSYKKEVVIAGESLEMMRAIGTQQGSSLLCPQLEKLQLEKLPDLRNITKLVALDSCTHLQSLFICRCPKIKGSYHSQSSLTSLIWRQFELKNVKRSRRCDELWPTMELIISNTELPRDIAT
ncbi:hypothetical protein RDABS01_023386 [Bienertia sinuspersici]